MKILSLIALTIISLSIGQDDTPASDVLTLAATASEDAAVTQTNFQPIVEDHYGNPDQFIQYIIRIPPVHA